MESAYEHEPNYVYIPYTLTSHLNLNREREREDSPFLHTHYNLQYCLRVCLPEEGFLQRSVPIPMTLTHTHTHMVLVFLSPTTYVSPSHIHTIAKVVWLCSVVRDSMGKTMWSQQDFHHHHHCFLVSPIISLLCNLLISLAKRKHDEGAHCSWIPTHSPLIIHIMLLSLTMALHKAGMENTQYKT